MSFLLSLLLVSAAPHGQTPSGAARLSGHVIVRAETPVPIRRAHVTLESVASGAPLATDSDDDGAFRFDRVPAGTWRLVAAKSGFVMIVSDSGRTWARPDPIVLVDGQSLAVDVALEPGAAIEGRLTTGRGEPAVNQLVSAVRIVHAADGAHLVSMGDTHSDDLGRYRLHTLQAGEYAVVVAPGSLWPNAQPTPVHEPRPGLARTFFPGTTRAEEARLVTVTLGETTRDTDITVTPVPLVAVSGTILDSSGQPPARAAVRLQSVNPLGMTTSTSAFRNQFSFSSVAGGDYYLTVTAFPTGATTPEYTANRVTIADRAITDMSITTARGATLAGQVTSQTSSPVPSGLVITLEPTVFHAPSLSTDAAAMTMAVSANGSFSGSAGVGPARARVDHLPDSWAVSHVTINGIEVSDAGAEFTSHDAPTAVAIVITDETGSVSGAVTDAQGHAVAARVVIFPDDEAQWTAASRTVRTVDEPAAGRVMIGGLLPGRYRAVAVNFLDDGAWLGAETLRQLRPSSTALTIDAHQTTPLSLTRVNLR